jgi:predicted nucleic acid-binding protein
MNTCLLDTGPLVAYLNTRDPAHDLSTRALDRFAGQFITTSAVVTEAMFFAICDPRGPGQLLDFIRSSRTKVFDCCQPNELKGAVKLMQKYADTPMDFADATLVFLADVLNQNNICTLDRRGFSTYRTSAGKRFNLVPEDFAT